MRRFSRLRWIFLCACGLRHRRGEHWFLVQRGKPPEAVSRCTRCGIRTPGGLAH